MVGVISSEAELKLKSVQHKLYSDCIPVLILIEGAGGDLMGRLVNEVMTMLEPRGVEYHHFKPSGNMITRELDFIRNAPAKGRICLYDRGWYSSLIDDFNEGDKAFSSALDDIISLERYMADNGIVIVKLYLDMKSESIEEHRKSYPKATNTDCGELGDDIARYSDFSVSNGTVSKVIEKTDMPYAPWDTIEVADYRDTVAAMIRNIIKRLEHRVQYPNTPIECSICEDYLNPREMMDLTKTMSKDEYQEKLEKYQKDLAMYQCKLARSGKSMILLFEGWDAAGKGGSIRRVTRALNPRGYKAVSICKPTTDEYLHTHLWRFCNNIPKTGRITIFDRSWYGRMMVEPIEGFCTREEYERSANEINMFEKVLIKNDVIIVKFWMEVSKEEQLNRFNARAADPMKEWKITDEDWRNREKWDVYEKYVDSMMKQTNTPYAPWNVIEGDDKRCARIGVLKILIETLKKELS